ELVHVFSQHQPVSSLFGSGPSERHPSPDGSVCPRTVRRGAAEDHRRSGGVSSPRFDDAVSVSPVQTDQISPESSGADLRLLRLGGFPEIVDPAGRRKNRRGRAVNRPFGTLQGLQRIGRRHRHRSADIPGGTPGGGSVISFRRGQDMLRWVEKGQWRVTAVEEWILFVLIGLLAGTFGSLAGLGGGVIAVPSLLLMAALFPEYRHLTPQVVVGTSLVMIVLTALSSTLTYARQRRVDYRSGLL